MSTDTISRPAALNELFTAIDTAATSLLALLAPLTEEQMNAIPFSKSWTAAQLATHVTKSNNGMSQALEMQGKPAERKPDERVKELKDTFLDFSIKMESPAFIVPKTGIYEKARVLSLLEKSNEQLKEQALKADPVEMINLPAAFGEITKLELLHFVLYHTQRHIHQLENIRKYIQP